MKKLGFTLSEVVIALGIVGVVAAITSPMISGLIPDKNKVLVLKTYKTITDINEQLLSTPAYYWKPADVNCIKLGCTQVPLVPGLEDAGGAAKYPRLLAYNLDTVGTISSTKFTTIDKAVWTFSGAHDGNGGAVIITVDFKDNGSSKVFSATNKNPDTFKFRVDVHGGVTGEDSLTKAYLANPYKLNDRKTDYKKALGR